MVSIDIGGEPILILSLSDVKILHAMLDMPETDDQTKVTKKVLDFINDPKCLEWEEQQNDGTQCIG